MSNQHKRALVLLATGAEEMETVIIVDVLRRAGIEVILAGIDGDEPVVCSQGVRLLPDAALSDVSGEFDLVVLPGGAEGSDRLAASHLVGSILRRQERAKRELAAICAGPAALVAHGVAFGKEFTSHPSVRERLAGHGRYRQDRVVEDDGLVTSRGPGTAFEFALTLVRRLLDAAKADALQAPMMI